MGNRLLVGLLLVAAGLLVWAFYWFASLPLITGWTLTFANFLSQVFRLESWLSPTDVQNILKGLMASLLLLGLLFVWDIVVFNIAVYRTRVNVELATFDGDELVLEKLFSDVQLKDVYGNRFLYWRVLWQTFHTKPDDIVMRFGSHARAILTPFRDMVTQHYSTGIFHRNLGLPYVKDFFDIVMTFDVSEDTRSSYRPRVVVIKRSDLINFFEKYPVAPRLGPAYPSVRMIARVYHEPEGRKEFVKVRITIEK